LLREGAEQAAQDAARARELASHEQEASDDETMAPVKMVVVDGIVMGPTHCAYGDCTSALGNARGGVFCPVLEAERGTKCHTRGCTNTKKVGTLACTIPGHQEQWS
jgi:hypothetical protein